MKGLVRAPLHEYQTASSVLSLISRSVHLPGNFFSMLLVSTHEIQISEADTIAFCYLLTLLGLLVSHEKNTAT